MAFKYPVLIALTSICATVTGVVGLMFHGKGKAKIRKVMDYAQGEVNKEYGGGVEIQNTRNGVGFVYSF